MAHAPERTWELRARGPGCPWQLDRGAWRRRSTAILIRAGLGGSLVSCSPSSTWCQAHLRSRERSALSHSPAGRVAARIRPSLDSISSQTTASPGSNCHVSIASVGSIDNPVDVAAKALGSDRTPDVDSFVEQADEDLHRLAHGRSPLSGRYLTPGPPTSGPARSLGPTTFCSCRAGSQPSGGFLMPSLSQGMPRSIHFARHVLYE